MHDFIIPIYQFFIENSNAEKSMGMKKYMKNQFEYFGINMPERRKFTKAYLKLNSLDSITEIEKIVKELWNLPQREFQYVAIELLAFYKKLWTIKTIKTIEFCITHKSWWDTVDFLASHVCNPYFKIFPLQTISITSGWNNSNNIWLQRSSLLFQLKNKNEINTELLEKYITNLITSKEFFIRKAIGWILREYAKTNKNWVKQFVNNHPELSGLSKREALKHFL
jgi:3-methyladenine DNA glycosylase AlkD